MRQIASLPERDARKLADYLLTQGIQTQILPEDSSWGLWVCDEDHLAKARAELAEFLKDPTNPRYEGAARAAQEVRRREEQEEGAYQRRQAQIAERMAQGMAGHPPYVTLVLILASLGVSLASGTAFMGNVTPRMSPVLRAVLIKSDLGTPGLDQIAEGQIWRLVTPIFLHFGPYHLLLDLLAMLYFGTIVESRRGSLRMALLVLALAVASNLGQYFWSHNPFFGGLSGVVFGLFGYAWMKSRVAPEMGLYVSPSTVACLVAWFFLCMTPILGNNVANAAHAVGLALGIIIGAVPHLLSRHG